MTQIIESEEKYDPNALQDPNHPTEVPTIIDKPQNKRRTEGEDMTFQALISANPRPRIIWFKDGQRLLASERIDISLRDNMATLTLRLVSGRDSGYYTLYLENPNGIAIHSVFLNVESSNSRPQTSEPQYQPNVY